MMIGDWEWVDDRLSSAGLVYGTPDSDVSVQINTVTEDPRSEVVRAIERATDISPRRPDYAKRHKAVQDTPGDAESIRVDGARVEFTRWGGRDRWWAAGTVDDVSLVIEARDYPIDSVDLIEINDIAPYLAGWRECMRTFRGGI